MLGVGTRKPKSCASDWKLARRMKCSVFVFSSQTITADSAAIATNAPAGGAGAHAAAGRSPSARRRGGRIARERT